MSALAAVDLRLLLVDRIFVGRAETLTDAGQADAPRCGPQRRAGLVRRRHDPGGSRRKGELTFWLREANHQGIAVRRVSSSAGGR
jgi:hypothetical protein